MGRTSYTVDAARAGQARTASGLTQTDAAQRLGINRVTMNKVENGRTNVSLDLLERMATLYGRSREWLIGEPEVVDQVEEHRERIANALARISEGFEQLDAALSDRVREVASGGEIQADTADAVVGA